jgi:hypothetical protein
MRSGALAHETPTHPDSADTAVSRSGRESRTRSEKARTRQGGTSATNAATACGTWYTAMEKMRRCSSLAGVAGQRGPDGAPSREDHLGSTRQVFRLRASSDPPSHRPRCTGDSGFGSNAVPSVGELGSLMARAYHGPDGGATLYGGASAVALSGSLFRAYSAPNARPDAPHSLFTRPSRGGLVRAPGGFVPTTYRHLRANARSKSDSRLDFVGGPEMRHNALHAIPDPPA